MIFQEFGNDPVLIWSPVIEPDFGQPRFLTAHPIHLITSGQFKKVPFIIGQTKDEFGQFAFSKFYTNSGLKHYIKKISYYTCRIFCCLFPDVVNNETLSKEMNENFEKVAPISFLYERDTDFSKTVSKTIKTFYLQDKNIDKSQLTPLAQVKTSY